IDCGHQSQGHCWDRATQSSPAILPGGHLVLLSTCQSPNTCFVPTPSPLLSAVMEINELIQKRQLLEAFASIKYLEDETIAERDAEKYKDNPQEFVRKSKDVDLLYNSITNAIQSIVVGTLEHPTVEDTMLTSLVTLIAREEAAHPNTGNSAGPGSDLLGTPRKWREEWREAINESARKRVLGIPMASKEEKSSWLDLHLAFLQKHLSEDLLKIKLSVKKCYPEEYRVCDMYVEAFHKAIALHLQDLSQRPLEFNELYTLLDWVIIGEHMKISGEISRSLETKMLELCLTELHEFIPRSLLLRASHSFQMSPILLKKQGKGPCTGPKAGTSCLWQGWPGEHVLTVCCLCVSPLCPWLLLKTQGLPLPSLTAVALHGTHRKTMRFAFFNQELLRDVHKYVVSEYIKQVIKPRQKMNKETRQQVSEKMNQEARILNNTLIDQGSDSDWLLPAIHHIANIVGEKKTDKIKEYVKLLCQDYPDIRYIKQQMPELLAAAYQKLPPLLQLFYQLLRRTISGTACKKIPFHQSHFRKRPEVFALGYTVPAG
uniref:Exocyst complex component Sec6 n=1 Tax=Otus sunia TaxID=257818 RepID=A0A8C8AB01_9STRI